MTHEKMPSIHIVLFLYVGGFERSNDLFKGFVFFSIKGPDTMANLVWANTYISGCVLHNLVDIVKRSTYALHTSLCAVAD